MKDMDQTDMQPLSAMIGSITILVCLCSSLPGVTYLERSLYLQGPCLAEISRLHLHCKFFVFIYPDSINDDLGKFLSSIRNTSLIFLNFGDI